MKVAPMRHVKGAVVVHVDITQRKLAEQELKKSHALLESRVRERTAELATLAHHDQLTGLANRLLFNARLEQAVKRAQRHGS
jgi:PleD family two-component response regulator